MLIRIVFCILICSQSSFSQAPTHAIWNELLKKYVLGEGTVDYSGFIKDSLILNTYLKLLSENPPQQNWAVNEQKAFWINAYNAFTIQLVIRNYPIKSIKDIGGKIPFINSSWDIKFIKVGEEILDLNNIEHSKLRKQFKDPRLHMVLVCASISCPALRNEAYQPALLENQLDDQCRRFLADPNKNRLKMDISEISMIFKWYRSDFKGTGGVIGFINKYGPLKISGKTKISYGKYNWDLNTKK